MDHPNLLKVQLTLSDEDCRGWGHMEEEWQISTEMTNDLGTQEDAHDKTYCWMVPLHVCGSRRVYKQGYL